MYEAKSPQAKAQDERHWRVDAKLTPSPAGERLDVNARDAPGSRSAASTRPRVFERPTDRRLDREVVLVEERPAVFTAAPTSLPANGISSSSCRATASSYSVRGIASF